MYPLKIEYRIVIDGHDCGRIAESKGRLAAQAAMVARRLTKASRVEVHRPDSVEPFIYFDVEIKNGTFTFKWIKPAAF